MSSLYTIRAVESKTGLSQHTIRAWERRYGAVHPQRTGTNRRLYRESDIEKLSLLKAALAAGHGISHVAPLNPEEIRSLLDRPSAPAAASASTGLGEVLRAHLDQCKLGVLSLDAATLQISLDRCQATLGSISTVTEIVHPLIEWIGDEWHMGRLNISHEHMASAAIRSFLDRIRTNLAPLPTGKTVIVATPAGQVHEMGAQIVAVALAVAGHRVVYLGADLPSEEIAVAARSTNATAVCLSLVYVAPGSNIEHELERLAVLLGNGTKLVLGGRAVPSLETVRNKIGAARIDSLDDLEQCLSSN